MANVLGDNPFSMLTFIVAPAILTNASSVVALGTSNRFARAVDRARQLSAQLETADSASASTEPRLRQLKFAGTRLLLLVRALTCFYVSVGSFAAASLVSLLGAVFFVAHQDILRQGMLAIAIFAGFIGVGGLVYGTSLLVRETRMALRILAEETAFIERNLAERHLSPPKVNGHIA